jgi:hypothetical protein
MKRTKFFTLPVYRMPDQSKGGMDPAVDWFEINPTCSPVFITEGPGLIFHKSYIHNCCQFGAYTVVAGVRLP